jgi:hypothetical protein
MAFIGFSPSVSCRRERILRISNVVDRGSPAPWPDATSYK